MKWDQILNSEITNWNRSNRFATSAENKRRIALGIKNFQKKNNISIKARKAFEKNFIWGESWILPRNDKYYIESAEI